MADVNAEIHIGIDSSQALGQLRSLQSQISSFNQSIIAGNVAAAQAQNDMVRNLSAQVNATKAFSTSMVNVESSATRLGKAIDKNRLSLGQYFRYGIAASGTFGKGMREHAEIMELAGQRVKRLQTQYIALGEAQNGVTRAMAMRPTQLFNADTAIATQRQQLFNKLLHDGSTSLVNWGKNTQWAGRQLMVGFTVPLTIFGGVAGKIFMDLEKQVVQFKRVYGDLQTPMGERNAMVEEIKALGKEFTKYGITVSDTMALAAKAAATGAQGADLLAATTEATRLATLGQIDYQQALDATISLQTAFGISSEDLADSTNFLNAVENQTVTSLDDITQAIPLVAPVIKGLGGDVKDLAIFMTAMREGGISANEGANALKSGLASLINPTKAAREQLAAVGINIDAILSKNKGDLRGLVSEFGTALGSLGKFERQQTLAKMFGKYQFARLGALFANISKDGSQAQRVIDLTAMSLQDLGSIAEGELGQLEQAVGTKFTAAVERLKLAIAPIGEAFLKIATPIIEFATKIADKFNELPDAAKTFITIGTAISAVAVPAIIMIVGLLGNFAGNMLKISAVFGRMMGRITSNADAYTYLAEEQLDAAAAAASLEGKTTSLTGALNVQRGAVNKLTSAYKSYVSAAGTAASNIPQGFRGTARRMATGGIVPGTGNKDTVPAMLTPGESVITKDATKKYGPVLAAMNAGTLPGFVAGEISVGSGGTSRTFTGNFFNQRARDTSQQYLQQLVDELVEDGMNIDAALDRVEKIFNDFAEVGKRVSKAALTTYAKDEGLTRQSRTLVAAHLTPEIQKGSQEYVTALSQTSEGFQRFHAVNGQYVKAVSKLTATLPSLLNQQLRVGLGFESFASQWSAAGDEILFNAAQLMDPTILADQDAANALKSMATEIRDRAIQVAAQSGKLKVSDAELQIATAEVVEQYSNLEGATGRAAKALDAASKEVGQFRTSVPRSVFENNPDYEIRGSSVYHVATGVEAARLSSRGTTRPGSNVGPGLATASAAQQEMFSASQIARIEQQSARAGAVAGEALHDSFVAATGDIIGDSITKYTNSPHPESPSQARIDGTAYGENFVASAQAAMQKAGQRTGTAATPFGAMKDLDTQRKARLDAAQRKRVEAEINKEISKRAMILQRQGVSAQAALAMAKEEVEASRRQLVIEEQILEVQQKQSQTSVVPPNARMLPVVSQTAGAVDKSQNMISKGAKSFGRALMKGSAKINGVGFALDGLVFGLSMMNNGVGEFAQKIMPVVFGLQGLSMMLPLLLSPVGLLVGGFAALAALVVIGRNKLSDMFDKAQQSGESMAMSFDNVSKIAGAFGKDVSTFGTGKLGFQTKQKNAAQQYFETEEGAKQLEAMQAKRIDVGRQSFVKTTAQEVATAAISAGLSGKQIDAYISTLAEKMNDKQLYIELRGELASMLDPRNQKDILTNGLLIKVNAEAAEDFLKKRFMPNEGTLKNFYQDIQTLRSPKKIQEEAVVAADEANKKIAELEQRYKDLYNTMLDSPVEQQMEYSQQLAQLQAEINGLKAAAGSAARTMNYNNMETEDFVQNAKDGSKWGAVFGSKLMAGNQYLAYQQKLLDSGAIKQKKYNRNIEEAQSGFAKLGTSIKQSIRALQASGDQDALNGFIKGINDQLFSNLDENLRKAVDDALAGIEDSNARVDIEIAYAKGSLSAQDIVDISDKIDAIPDYSRADIILAYGNGSLTLEELVYLNEQADVLAGFNGTQIGFLISVSGLGNITRAMELIQQLNSMGPITKDNARQYMEYETELQLLEKDKPIVDTTPTGKVPGPPPPPPGPEDKKGGGAKEKSWLEQQIENNAALIKLYTTAGKRGSKLVEAKGFFFGIMEKLRTGQRGKFGKKSAPAIPQFILDSLGTGPEGVKNAMALWKMTEKELNKFIRESKKGFVGEFVNNKRKEIQAKADRGTATTILQQSAFGFTKDEIEQVIQDQDAVNAILLSKGKEQVEVIKTIKEALVSAAEEGPKVSLDQIFIDVADAQDRLTSLLRQREEMTLIKPIEDEIAAIEKQNDEYDRSIDLKQREIDQINEVIQRYEEQKDKINEIYDARIKALDEIEKANERINKIQQAQLGIAQSLSRGDVAGAATAAQQLQQQLAADRAQSTRDALENARAAQLREFDRLINIEKAKQKAIENEIKDLQEKQYQNNQLIYAKQQEIAAINDRLDQQFKMQGDSVEYLDAQIRLARDALIAAQAEAAKLTAELQKAAAAGASITGGTSPTYVSGEGSIISQAPELYGATAAAVDTTATNPYWIEWAKTVGDMSNLTFAMGGMVPKYFAKGGYTRGSDTVPAMLTPGEFVMKKSAVEKYGPALLSSMNMGSISMPKYGVSAAMGMATPQPPRAETSSPVYNYDLSVNVSGTNASPDEIANAVMQKIKMTEDRRIRSNRY